MRNRYASSFSGIGIAILLSSQTGSVNAQHFNTRSGPFDAGADRATGDTIEVPPGFSFFASYYYWVDVLPGAGSPETADIVLETPVPWVESLTFPAGQTSTDCASPFPSVLRINAPAVTGIYTVNVVDLTGEWATWELILKVVDIPTSVANTITDTVLVNVAQQTLGTASAVDGITDVACPPLPYYPTGELLLAYTYHPPAPWVSITPDSLIVAAGAIEYPVIELFSAVDGLFTTYRYRAGSWYFWPQILKYEVLFVLATEVPASPGLPGVDGVLLYPNPAQHTLNVQLEADRPIEGWLVFSDALGREALRSLVRFGLGKSTEPVDVSQLADGAYSCMLVVPGSGSTLSGRVIIAR